MKGKREGSKLVASMKAFLTKGNISIINTCYKCIRDENENRSFIKELEAINNADFDAYFPLVTMVIITANKIECDSLIYCMSQIKNCKTYKRREKVRIFENRSDYAPDAYIYQINSTIILHLHASKIGSNTPGGSSDLIRYITKNRLLHPNQILSFGICYGRDYEKQSIGDVLIPKKLYPWSIGQRINEQTLTLNSDEYEFSLANAFPSSGLYSWLSQFCNGEDGDTITYTMTIQNRSITFSPNIKLCNMSTGEAVVSSARAKKMIRKANRNEEELGGEMEGYGLAKECILYSHIPCFIIKSICDWGEKKEIEKAMEEEEVSVPTNLKDKLQAYAAFCAGAALLKFMHDNYNDLFKLEAIQWMKDYKSYLKDTIIRKLQTYYNIDNDKAHDIFCLMKAQKLLFEDSSGEKYYKKSLEEEKGGIE